MAEHLDDPAYITAVAPVNARIVYLEFLDGSRGHVDLSPWLNGPVFDEISASDDAFEQVALDGTGSIAWPNGADLDPDVLRLSLVPLQVVGEGATHVFVGYGAVASDVFFDRLVVGNTVTYTESGGRLGVLRQVAGTYDSRVTRQAFQSILGEIAEENAVDRETAERNALT